MLEKSLIILQNQTINLLRPVFDKLRMASYKFKLKIGGTLAKIGRFALQASLAFAQVAFLSFWGKKHFGSS